LDHLWAGQCNCSYWHGVFGGLYLPILRNAIYRNLIESEKALDRSGGKKIPAKITVTDYDSDGEDEAIVETPVQNLYVAPAQGGMLFEWDFKAAGMNIGNVLTRRPEPYHRKLKLVEEGGREAVQGSENASIRDIAGVKEKGLDQHLSYDWYRRASLLDHFLHPSTTPEGFRKCSYGEQGDFVLEPYLLEVPEKKSDASAIVLSREGRVWVGDRHCRIRVEKKISFGEEKSGGAVLTVDYRVQNLEDHPVGELWFAPEFDFSFSVPEPDQDRGRVQAKEWARTDRYLGWGLKAGFSAPTDFWVCPLETVSNSEGGFERTFQGVVFLPNWKMTLPAGKSEGRTFTFRLEASPA
jgi:alpha-amylase